MSVYNKIVEAIDELNDEQLEIKDYLQSLKPDVRQLRASYRKPPPVYVDYAKQNIQSAYLITYLPHYYQLIYKILLEQDLQLMKSKADFSAVFIGGGPGSEAYGTVKYILEYCPNIKNINIDILDINAGTWNYSHSALTGFLLPELNRFNDVSLHWNSHQFDLVDSNVVSANRTLFDSADLVVIQNCINEIAQNEYQVLENNILDIFNFIPNASSLLLVDLTTSVRSQIAQLEKAVEAKFPDINKNTTSGNRSASAVTSINYIPSQIIRENLLNKTDGLWPRKHLKYDFSLLNKNLPKEKQEVNKIGINAIYRPLDNLKDSIQNLTDRSFIGIDFGTSSSVCSIAYVQDDKLKVELLEIEQKDHLGIAFSSTIVPSIIGIINNRFLLGKYANERRADLTLGTDGWYGFKENLIELKSYAYPTSKLYDHAEFPIKNAADALIVFLKRLKAEIDKIINDKQLPFEKRYSFSTPANYGLKEKELLESYIIQAGYEEGTFAFIEEPVSSLLGTIHQENLALDLEDDLNILVIDVGAGTVDCCAIRLVKDSDNVIAENLAIYRNSNMGGNLINRLIANRLFEKDNSLVINDDFISKNCEDLKLEFCKSVRTDAQVHYALPELSKSEINKQCNTRDYGNYNSIDISYSEFNDVMTNYFNGNENFKGFKSSIDKTVNEANLSRDDFNYVIISGGGAKNPYLRSLCADYFEVDKIVMPNNSQEQVGFGNAIQSFVSNAFGKQIIESVLNGGIYIYKNDNHTLIFEKGEVLPTLEYESMIDAGTYSIILYSDVTDEKVRFDWQQHINSNPLKFILKVNQESRIICDLVTDKSIIRLKPEINKQ
ncbi:Hsp70 family protein [Winogradskyella schleiferi]|uniref:Hsp70 family protein n=1 Tax=Winogradskyella schleiferi TaxID=2686078 RepID=UPI0015BB6A77|nr:Hsp70 family protein [Winogradskyella schleiferi]